MNANFGREASHFRSVPFLRFERDHCMQGDSLPTSWGVEVPHEVVPLAPRGERIVLPHIP